MTDAELIELVQTKTASELTDAEIEELRQRITESVALREALAQHLEIERYLADTLAQVRISPEQILDRADRSAPATGFRNWLRPWAALALLIGSALVVGLVWRSLRSGGESKPVDDTNRIAVVPSNPSTVNPEDGKVPPVPPPGPEIKPTPTPTPINKPTPEPVPVAGPAREPAPEPFALVDLSEDGLSEEQVKSWFAPVEGQPHELKVVPANQYGATTEMSGLWRVRSDWVPGSALRCLFRTTQSIKFHLWNGNQGITLEIWRGATTFPGVPDLTLVAYRTTRKGKNPQPETMLLVGRDEGEFSRTRMQANPYGYNLISTPIDLRHQDGLLTVSCGDVQILSVPMAAPPSEIYLDGKAALQGFGFAPLVALGPLPALLPTVLDVEKLGDREWLGDQKNLVKLADGSVELRSDKAAGSSAVATLLPARRICDVVVQLEGLTPGTGVYLGDEKGLPKYLVSFLRDETTGRTIVMGTDPAAKAVSVAFDGAKRWPPAFVGEKVWLRLRPACGQLNCWISCDGTHWARALEPPLGSPGHNWSTVGLFCQPGVVGGSIRLKRLILQELATLSSLAPADLVKRAPPAMLYTSLSDWLMAAQSFRPPEVDPIVWTRACAIQALGSGVSWEPGRTMLKNLVDYGLGQPGPVDAKIRLIDEALMMTPKFWSIYEEQALLQSYERLGEILKREEETRPYSRLRQALYHHPLWSTYAISVFPESLATTEMLDLAAVGKWEEAEKLAHFGRMHTSSPSIFDWAEALAAERQPQARPAGKRLLLPLHWQPSLVLEQNKESTTDLRELEAACGANLFREAGRIMTRLEGRLDHGLLPSRNDDQWLMSLPVALGKLTEAHPSLRKTLRADFAAEARLELRRALEEKNERALESLALRYYGTEEAAEAVLWLGDRNLLDGETALASARFGEALGIAEGAALRRKIEDRRQLVAALLGHTLAAPAQGEIEFGAARLSAAALDALRKKRKEEGVDSRTSLVLPPQLAPVPTALEVVPHGKIEGELGEKPDALPYIPGSRSCLDVDWFARQIAVSAEGNKMFVSNRFQVDCYELPSGKLTWRTALSRDPARQEMPAPTYEYALTPMRPVVVGSRLFVRRLMRGPAGQPNTPPPGGVATLACLDTATGKVEWQTTNHLQGRLHYVSDPLVIQDHVIVIAEKQPLDADRSLTLLIHNRADGRLLAERSLASVLETYDRQRGCELTALEEGCIATVGGGVLCFDLAGNIRWARRQLFAPMETDPHWFVQPHDPPLVVGGRCYIVQPGVLNLLCLAPDSGQVHWQKTIAGLRRLTGLVDNRLLLQTDKGFLCLDAASGKEKWRHEASNMLSGTLCGGRGGLVYTSSVVTPGGNEMQEPRLVWVDLETGRERAQVSLKSLRHAQPKLGPLFVAGDRMWTFSGHGNLMNRDLVELAPKGQPLAEAPALTEWDLWTPTVSGTVRTAAAGVLPGWTVFDCKPLEKTGPVAEFKGETGVLCVAAPFAVGRHLDVPAVDKPQLLLRVASEVKRPGFLVVDVNGTRLWQQDLSSTTTDQWKDWQVDLSAYKGKRVWVVVRHIPGDGEPTLSYWKKIALMQ